MTRRAVAAVTTVTPGTTQIEISGGSPARAHVCACTIHW